MLSIRLCFISQNLKNFIVTDPYVLYVFKLRKNLCFRRCLISRKLKNLVVTDPSSVVERNEAFLIKVCKPLRDSEVTSKSEIQTLVGKPHVHNKHTP